MKAPTIDWAGLSPLLAIAALGAFMGLSIWQWDEGIVLISGAMRVDSLAMFYTSVADGKEGVASFREKRDPSYTSTTADMPPFYPWQD